MVYFYIKENRLCESKEMRKKIKIKPASIFRTLNELKKLHYIYIEKKVMKKSKNSARVTRLFSVTRKKMVVI